ncbi:MAG: hypothetical protein Q9157_004664 [Trypethelium eluteriae]
MSRYGYHHHLPSRLQHEHEHQHKHDIDFEFEFEFEFDIDIDIDIDVDFGFGFDFGFDFDIGFDIGFDFDIDFNNNNHDNFYDDSFLPRSSGETALTLNQYYRVVCGGYYGASTLLSNSSHAAPYSLASCVTECVNYNVAGSGATTGTGNCSMVVLEPPSLGAGRAGYNCFSFAGLVSNDFAAANGLDWASGVLLSTWEAQEALCAPGPNSP